MLAKFKLLRDVCGYHSTMCGCCVRKDLRLSDCAIIDRNLDSNHVVCSLRPNRTVDLQGHGRVANCAELDRYGQWSLFTKDYLNWHVIFLSSRRIKLLS